VVDGSTLARHRVGRTGSGSDDHLFVVLAAHRGTQRDSASAALLAHGIRVAAVDSVDGLWAAMERLKPDVILVDVTMVGVRLAAVLALIRGAGTALIALAVRGAAMCTDLLLAGADDCLPAEYAPEELTARVIAVVRRSYRAALPDVKESLQTGPLRLDPKARRVDLNDSEVLLTAKEFDLLSFFFRHPGEVMSRERLLAEVWGWTFGSAETVTVHVRRLRSKIEGDPSRPELIQTVWGMGYRFAAG